MTWRARASPERRCGWTTPAAFCSKRAAQQLDGHRAAFAWLDSEKTALVQDERGRWAWWTFAGLNANASLTQALREAGAPVGQADNYRIALEAPTLVEAIHSLRERPVATIGSRAIDKPRTVRCEPDEYESDQDCAVTHPAQSN